MANPDDVLLSLAMPTEADIEAAKAEIVPALRVLLDAPLREDDKIIGTTQQ